jgi:hypothetical protein
MNKQQHLHSNCSGASFASVSKLASQASLQSAAPYSMSSLVTNPSDSFSVQSFKTEVGASYYPAPIGRGAASMTKGASFATVSNRKKVCTAVSNSAFPSEEKNGITSESKGPVQRNQQPKQNLIRRYIILGERRTSNYVWALIVFLGSFGFLFTGLSSYYEFSWLASSPILSVNNLSFFPQGLLMSFYGTLGFLLSIYWGFNIFWNVGGGFNEFNKKEGKIRVFRWGYPGKNRRIDLSYSLKDVEAIKVELKQGFDPQRTIYLKLKGKREIPLTGIGEPLTLKEIEKQASELANFLQVSLEGL